MGEIFGTLNSVKNIVLAFIAFGLLILVHEFGHFIIAKLNGVTVLEFSIGMGPKLFGVKKGETEYNVRLVLFGGYVRMLGEEGESSDEHSLTSKSPAKRLAIIIAGPFMNLVLAIVLFSIIIINIGIPIPTVGATLKNSPAQKVGMIKNDKIISINNYKIKNWDDISTVVNSTKSGSSLSITYSRNNSLNTVNLTPEYNKSQKQYLIGISPATRAPSFLEVTKYSFGEIKYIVNAVIGFFGTLFHGKAKATDFGGPVTIIRVSTQAANLGILNLMMLTAFISVQLAIFNVIPFPALDGGWIFLFLLEIITGKKFADEKVGIINYIGFVLLMILMVAVTIKDFLYPIKF